MHTCFHPGMASSLASDADSTAFIGTRYLLASEAVSPQRSGVAGCIFTQQLTVESMGPHCAWAKYTG